MFKRLIFLAKLLNPHFKGGINMMLTLHTNIDCWKYVLINKVLETMSSFLLFHPLSFQASWIISWNLIHFGNIRNYKRDLWNSNSYTDTTRNSNNAKKCSDYICTESAVTWDGDWEMEYHGRECWDIGCTQRIGRKTWSLSLVGHQFKDDLSMVITIASLFEMRWLSQSISYFPHH